VIRLSLAPIVGFPTSILPPQTGQSLIISFAFASAVAWTQKTKLMTLMSQAAASVFILTTPTAEIPEWVPMQTPLIFRHHFEEYAPLSLIPLRINHQFSQSLFPLTTPLGASLTLLQALKGNNTPHTPVQEVIGDQITPVVDTSSVSLAFIPVPLNPRKMSMAELFDYCPLFVERSAYKFSSGSPEALLKPKPFLEPPPEFSPLPPPPPSGGGNVPLDVNGEEGSLGSSNDTASIPQSHSILPPTGPSSLGNNFSAEFDYRPSFVERTRPPEPPKIKLKPLLHDFSPLPSPPPSGNGNMPPSAKLGPLNGPDAPLNPLPRSGSATFPPTDPSPIVNTSSTEEDLDPFASRKNSPFSSPVPTSRRFSPLVNDEDSDIDDDPLVLPPRREAPSLPLKASPKGKTVLEFLALER